MKFYLRVYDNFHYMDESEAYNYGQYETYEKALTAAKAIVDDFLKENWKAGIKPDELGACYSMYGEDPVILPNEHGEHERFSAWTYAHSISGEICRKLEDVKKI